MPLRTSCYACLFTNVLSSSATQWCNPLLPGTDSPGLGAGRTFSLLPYGMPVASFAAATTLTAASPLGHTSSGHPPAAKVLDGGLTATSSGQQWAVAGSTAAGTPPAVTTPPLQQSSSPPRPTRYVQAAIATSQTCSCIHSIVTRFAVLAVQTVPVSKGRESDVCLLASAF
jgi:hypothetical protein